MGPNGSSEDLLDEAALLIGMAFKQMRDEGKSGKEIAACAYDMSSAIKQFVAEVVNAGVGED